MKNTYDLQKKYKGKKIFITGGTGFVGSHLLKVLLEYDCKIHALYNIKNKGRKNIPGKLFWHEGDILDSKKMKKIIAKAKPDLIFHLAALIGSERNINLAVSLIETNFIGTLNVLTALKNVKFERLLFVGTAEEYGMEPAPFNESQKAVPVSPYGFSKNAASNLCLFYHRIFDYPITVLKPAVAYGPGQKNSMFIPSLIRSLKRNKEFKIFGGRQKRDFLYIDDLIQAIIKAAVNKKAEGEAVNIGSGSAYSLKEVAILAKKLSKSKSKISFSLPYRPFEIMNYSVDISKAKKKLGWAPIWTLEKGLEETINYYK